MIENLARDLRFGLRGLARNPGFTAVAVVLLGLGLGALCAVATVVYGLYVAALPFPEPERLVVVGSTHLEEGETVDWPVSYPDFRDWVERQTSFAELALHSGVRSFTLTAGGEVERARVEMASEGYFRLLGAAPVLGRVFAADEHRPEAPQRVAVLSHELWQSRFGGDPEALERPLVLNQETYDVVGVMPPGFGGVSDEAQLWVPVALAAEVLGRHYVASRPFRWLSSLGRLAPGVDLERARAELEGIAAGLAAEHPQDNEGVGVRLEPAVEAWLGDLRPALRVLAGGALLVLVLAWVNVAALLVVRTAARRPELAVRSALGAGRRRLVAGTLAESALLALSGGVLGVAVAGWGTRLLVAASGVALPGYVDVGLDPRVAAAILAVSLAGAAGFGLVPALALSGRGVERLLVGAGRGVPESGRQRLGGALVVVQVALALVLLAGAGLLLESFDRLRRSDLGFDPRGLLTLRLDLKGSAYAEVDAKRAAIRRLFEALPAAPGVGELVMEGPNLPTDGYSAAHFTIEERRGAGDDELVMMAYHFVSPGYFRTLGIPLLRGEDFRPSQDASVPYAVVVNDTAARRLWPGDEALGKRLKFGSRDGAGRWLTVQAVVADVRHAGRRDDGRPEAEVYLTLLQVPPLSPPTVNLLARPRAGGDGRDPSPATLAPALRQRMREVAPDLPLYDVAPLEERLAAQIARERFSALLLGLFAVLALVLAVVGIYGVAAYGVARRRRELGVRMALGADRARILGLVLRRTALATAAGLVVGLALTLTLVRLLAAPLAAVLADDVSPTDPGLLVAVALLLATAALAAALLPARRAARIDPAKTLRME